MAVIKKADAFIASPAEGIRLFLLHGDDAGGITERARRLEEVALKRGGGDTVIRFGSDEVSADPGCVADEAYAAALFGGEPVISIRVLDGRHNVIGALEGLLQRPPEAAWVIVEGGDLQKTSPLRKAFEASSAAAAIPTYPARSADLTSMIRVAASEAGIVVEPTAMELLADVLAGDRLAARGELEKLFLYVGASGRVAPADVQAIVGNVTEAATDAVIDAALSGDSEGLETGLDRMRAEGESAAGLGAMTLRHLISLQGLRDSFDRGVGAARLVERIYFGRRDAMQRQIERWPPDELSAARRRIADAVFQTRRTSALETAAISQALHETALQARRLR